MKRTIRLLACRLVMIFTVGATMYNTAWAQDYVAPPVSISKDKVKIDGEVFYSHVVLERQTLYSICKAYHVSFEDIYKYNPSVEEYGLRKNDIIIIPVVEIPEQAPVHRQSAQTPNETTVTPRSVNGEIRHAVKWYEDLATIAAKYGVSENLIMLANGMEDSKVVLMTLVKRSGCIVTLLGGKIFFKEKRIGYKLLCALIVLSGILLAVLL